MGGQSLFVCLFVFFQARREGGQGRTQLVLLNQADDLIQQAFAHGLAHGQANVRRGGRGGIHVEDRERLKLI